MAKGTWGEVLADFLLALRGSNKSPGTVKYYRDYLHALIDWCDEHCVRFVDFDRRALRRYLAWRKEEARHPLTGQPLAESTRRHDVVTARKFFAFARDEGWLEEDPLKDFPLPKASKVVIRCPSIEEVKALLQAIPNRWDVRRNPKARYVSVEDRGFMRSRDYAIVLTLLETGMRISEALALTFDDVILSGENPRMIVRTSKTKDGREIPITPAYVEAISIWAEHRETIHKKRKSAVHRAELRGEAPPDITNLWFCSTVQTPLDYGNFRRSFLKYLEFAGLERFTRHGIRHLFATIHANKNVISAMSLLGHKRLATTQGYCHEQQDRIRRDHAEVSPIADVLGTAPAPKRGRRRKAT